MTQNKFVQQNSRIQSHSPAPRMAQISRPDPQTQQRARNKINSTMLDQEIINTIYRHQGDVSKLQKDYDKIKHNAQKDYLAGTLQEVKR